MTTRRYPPEYEQLLVVLDEKVRSSGRTREDLEVELGFEKGALGPILTGQEQMEVHDLERLCEALGFDHLLIAVEASKRAAILRVGERIAARVHEEIELFLKEGPGTPR